MSNTNLNNLDLLALEADNAAPVGKIDPAHPSASLIRFIVAKGGKFEVQSMNLENEIVATETFTSEAEAEAWVKWA